jgi:hypothetical protein
LRSESTRGEWRIEGGHGREHLSELRLGERTRMPRTRCIRSPGPGGTRAPWRSCVSNVFGGVGVGGEGGTGRRGGGRVAAQIAVSTVVEDAPLGGGGTSANERLAGSDTGRRLALREENSFGCPGHSLWRLGNCMSVDHVAAQTATCCGSAVGGGD